MVVNNQGRQLPTTDKGPATVGSTLLSSSGGAGGSDTGEL